LVSGFVILDGDAQASIIGDMYPYVVAFPGGEQPFDHQVTFVIALGSAG
jgi:hypothetical protein